jgi:bacillithiol system protein YtxJ
MNWIKIQNAEDLEQIKAASNEQPVVIFKHSTTCSISNTALDRFQRAHAKLADDKGVKFYYLDLLNHRDISKKIAETFNVEHESPQAILVKKGEAVLDASHFGININDFVEAV